MQPRTYRFVISLTVAAALLAAPSAAGAHHGGDFRRCERVVFGGGLKAFHVRTHNLSCEDARRFIRVLMPSRFECAHRATRDAPRTPFAFRCRAGDQSLKFTAV